MHQQSKRGFLLLCLPLIIFLIGLKCVIAPRYTGVLEPLEKRAIINHTTQKISSHELDNPVKPNLIDSSSIQSEVLNTENKSEPIFSQIGFASFYADKFHGRRTAFGEKYDKNRYTAAHFTLPYNAIVKVTCLDNNKTVVVRINDRCPKMVNRIIDLSRISAEEIGFIKKGITKVKIEVFSTP